MHLGVFGGIPDLRVITFSIGSVEPISCFIILEYADKGVGISGAGTPPQDRGGTEVGLTPSRILQGRRSLNSEALAA